MTSISDLLDSAYLARKTFFDAQTPERLPENYHLAFRLLNGFLEGSPALSVDIYARTALIHNYAASPTDHTQETTAAQAWILNKLPWVQCIIVKTRNGQTNAQKRGTITYGKNPDHKIIENGIWYAIDLTMNRDASFYLDTRNLRSWAEKYLAGKTILNTFAYTGSLGVAALAGGAAQVIQLDRNASFLNLASQSYALNGFPIAQKDFLVQDFFPAVEHFKRSKKTFDCIFLDPPFFASTTKGTVDLETGSIRLINKIRPLINDNGYLVTINNALFVSGKDYIASIETLCASGYLAIEQLVPISADFTGYDQTRVTDPPVDPAPFNHPTKIAILRVRRKTLTLSNNSKPLGTLKG